MPSQPSNAPGHAVGFIIRAALVVSLIAMVASAARLFRKKPLEETPQQSLAEQDVTARPEPSPAPKPRKPFLGGESRQFRPVQTQRITPPGLSAESGASNLWAAVGSAPTPTPATGFLMAARLPELQNGIDGVVTRFEPPVFYQVPAEYGAELSNQLAEIRTATNDLKQFALELHTLVAGADRDHKDYVQQAKLANAQRRAEASAAAKRLTDLQALYLERKREFQQESARLKPQLQDSPAQFEAKLVLHKKASSEYQQDIDQLEAGIHSLQKQVQATGDALNAQDENIEQAYELSAQDVMGQLTVLSNRVQSKLGEVNTAIRDYNANLGLHGRPLSAQR